MPSSQTITSFFTFTPDTLIESAHHNTNFGVFRGHIIPVNPNTSTAGTTGSYDIGSSEYSWRNVYTNNIVFATAAANVPNWNKYSVSFTQIQAATTTNFTELFSSPSFGTLDKIAVRQTVGFTGTGLTGVRLMIGTSADFDRFVLPWDAYSTPTVENVYNIFDVPSFSTTTSVRLYATASGSTLDSLASGSLDVYVLRGSLE